MKIVDNGNYLWRSASGDFPVKVVGSFGKGPDGRIYAKVEGSNTAVPQDELIPTDKKENISRKPKSINWI